MDNHAFWFFLYWIALSGYADDAQYYLDEASAQGRNIFLALAVVILGVGHIGIHLMHRKEVNGNRKG